MKLSLLLVSLVGLFAMSLTVVQADELQDEIDQAMKKFCGGIKVTAPAKNAVFSNPKKVQVTVTRQPNAQAKVINGVDIYSINAKGKASYLGTPWKGSYALDKKATLSVDVTKVKNLHLPSQFEFRVWVHNQKGPDCTLMSNVFKVKSSAHSNAAEEEALANLDTNIDRGCFGLELTKPALGAHQSAKDSFQVQVKRDSSSHVDTITSLALYKVDLDSRQPSLVQESWDGSESVHSMFNIKDTLKKAPASDGKQVAYFYKLSGVTEEKETCDFYSHPFYIDA